MEAEEIRAEELEDLRVELIDFWHDGLVDANIEGKLQAQVFKAELGKFLLRLKATFMGEHTEEVQVPEDWWQAVRERWLPDWWLQRRPIKYTTIQILYVCPHMQVPVVTAPYVHLHWLKKSAKPFEEVSSG